MSEKDQGIFADWETRTIAAQCRMQARENLDPEYSQFMNAAADRLDALSHPDLKAERDALMEAMDAGVRSFCRDEPDFTMSSGMRRSAIEHILAQPGLLRALQSETKGTSA